LVGGRYVEHHLNDVEYRRFSLRNNKQSKAERTAGQVGMMTSITEPKRTVTWLPLALLLLALCSNGSGIQSTTVCALQSTWAVRRRHHHHHNRISAVSPTARLQKSATDDENDEASILPIDQVEYGKFVLAEDPMAPLPPLPDFLNEPLASYSSPPPLIRPPSAAVSASAASSADDATQQILRQQQAQIDLLIKAIQSQTAAAATPITTATITPPLKVMLFIDGTWLYYSIHERPKKACPITQQYGTNNRPWQSTYKVDWAALIKVIADSLTQQNSVWTQRGVSIERAFCFTSYKKDTSPTSHRVRMFEDMRDANYDCYIMDTTGPGEKCVDIQLAVEMMHYATVPDAYDVAVLLSGDKDFLPALVRTRQKARKVALVSMRTACNRALYETPNVLDYDVIWMENYMDRWIVEKEGHVTKEPIVSTFTVLKVIYDYLDKSGMDKVSSRDIGRYLKSIKIGRSTILDQAKILVGTLFRFLLFHKEVFEVVRRSPQEEKAGMRTDSDDRAFWVALQPNAGRFLSKQRTEAIFNQEEKTFFDSYSLARLSDKEEEYPSSMAMLGDPKNSGGDVFRTGAGDVFRTGAGNSPPPHQYSASRAITQEDALPAAPSTNAPDYSQWTVPNLKELCRERGLQVSGTKAVLLQRVETHLHELQEAPTLTTVENSESQLPKTAESRFFVNHIRDYLTASGGEASSRDVGRYLAAAPGMARVGRGSSSALTELKEQFSSLSHFVDVSGHFYRCDGGTGYEFTIGLLNESRPTTE
jgi:uncharacterized LabA/DUF88 family protein